MVNREEVAVLSGVSSMTVTRVVSGKGYVSEATKNRVQKAIEETGYIPNKVASSLVCGKSNKIAIIVPELKNPYYLQVVDAMINEAKKYRYIVSIFKANEEELPVVLGEIISDRFAGVVNYTTEFPKRFMKYLKDIDAKLIRADFEDKQFRMELSYKNAIESAVNYLLKRGAEKFIFISGMSKKFTMHDKRVPTFIEIMKNKGINVDEDDIIYGNYPIEDAFKVGLVTGKELLKNKRKFDAVFCMNDIMAIGFINAMKQKHIVVPDDVAVIGFDNVLMSEYFAPSLSTVSTDIKKEASLYVNYIVGNSQPDDVDLHAEFIARESVNLKNNKCGKLKNI